MTVEITLLISIASIIISTLVSITNIKRNNRNDVKNDTTELATVIVKLENIGMDTRDIKNEMKGIHNEINNLRERIVVAEESNKQLLIRIDSFDSRLSKMEGTA